MTDSVDDGTLKLTLTADRATYAEGDAIAAVATIEYLGPEPSIPVSSSPGVVIFSVDRLDGPERVQGGDRLSCVGTTLERGVPRAFPWAKSGSFDPADPTDTFAETYLTSGPELRLPAGTWRLVAGTAISGAGCVGPERALSAEVVVTVEPATAASTAPSPAALTPVPSPRPPVVRRPSSRVAS